MALNMNIDYSHACSMHVCYTTLRAVCRLKWLYPGEKIGICFFSTSLPFTSTVLCLRDVKYGAHPWQREHNDI